MHEETIEYYLQQIFGGRRYCHNCKAMTPANSITEDPLKPAVEVNPAYCDICFRAYTHDPGGHLFIVNVAEKMALKVRAHQRVLLESILNQSQS
jgi:hypothetical protein